MADSFTDLRDAGGSNKPWIAAGVGALAVALILIALAGAWWSAQPPAEDNRVPDTVTVTAQPGSVDKRDELAPPGTYSGMLTSLDPDARAKAWPAVATFGGGSALVAYPDSGCIALIDDTLRNRPLTDTCNAAPGAEGAWRVDDTDPGLVHLTFLLDGEAIVEGTLSVGLL